MNSDTMGYESLSEVVNGLDRWLESMRQPGGYGGPVAHWWDDCLDYTSAGLDWRYEGILFGYLNLWARTANPVWLEKARRAGDDLIAGQLPSGNYRNSQFELNPGTGGTPHEAACDLGLLKLAETLRNMDEPAWEGYFQTAETNLKKFYLRRLWDQEAGYFRDDAVARCFVPNKSATLTEALFAYARLSRQADWVEQYALPTLQAVLDHQVVGGELDGAIYQNSFGSRKVAKFFPYYIARCIPGLLEGSTWSGEERFAEGVRRAASFILRWRYTDGSFPQVVYPSGRVNRYPQWVAAIGDILRALDLARNTGIEYDPEPSLRWLLAGLRPDGAFRTALGFDRATPGGSPKDPRDDLAVVGWNDKVFRYLTGLLLAQPAWENHATIS
jgi:hypothetical protein